MEICIVGDSWACGEWTREGEKGADDQYKITYFGVTHRGLQFYLESLHTVTNLGVGGASNSSAIKRLAQQLQLGKKFDYIFWFKTDPLRDLRPYDFFRQPSISLQKLLDKQDFLTLETYKTLNDLGVTIHCIGGASKLNLPFIKNFSNLVPYIPCLSEMIEPTYQHPIIWHSDWQQIISRQVDIDSLEKLVEFKKQQDQLFDFKKNFWPDGRHPNRHGHKILYEKICKDFNL